MIICNKWIIKALIRLGRCAGWSAHLLFGNPRRQFSRDEAHITVEFNPFKMNIHRYNIENFPRIIVVNIIFKNDSQRNLSWLNNRFTWNRAFKPLLLMQRFGTINICDIQIDGRQGAGRPKLTWKKLMEKDCRELKLMTVDPQERSTWRSGVRSAMHAASQLSHRRPTDVDDASAPAC